MPQHRSDTSAERAAALSGSYPGSFLWFKIHVNGLCFSVQITLLISYGEVVLMIWSSQLMIAYNLSLFPGFKRDVILNSWHCTLSARSHPQHQMFFFFCSRMFCYDCENIALNRQMFLILKPIVGVPPLLCLCFFLSPWTVSESVLFYRHQDSGHMLKLHRPPFAYNKVQKALQIARISPNLNKLEKKARISAYKIT